MNQYLLFSILIGVQLTAQTVSFDQLKSDATKNSHRLKLKNIDISIETARLESVYSTLYPQLSLAYSSEYSRNLDNASTGSISVGDMTINSATLYKNSMALHLNYELYHFGATMKQIEIGEREISLKELEWCHETIKLYAELLDHYAKAQKAFSTSTYKSRMLLLRKELYTLKQRLYSAGKESRVSIGDEAIRIIDLEREIEKAKLDYDESLIALSKLSYNDLDPNTTQLLPLTYSFEPIKELDFDTTAQSKQYDEKILQKNAEISITQRSQLPTVSLYSSYYLYGSDIAEFSEAMDATRPNSWNAGVSMRWNLFEGFKYNSESKRLRYELQRIKEEYELARREYDYETKTKQEHLTRLEQLTRNEIDALHETQLKITMTQRLRTQGEADAVSEVSVKLEALERELTLAIETIQQAYEAQSLATLHTKADQCTQH